MAIPLKKLFQAMLVVALLSGSGCVFQGKFAERRPLSDYRGDARASETHRFPGGWALKAALHTHTDWSHGALSIDELVDVARSNGVAVLGVTEHDMLEACYTRCFCFRDPSVSEMGYEKYFRRMAEVQQSNHDLVILPALELIPDAYWRGFPPWVRLLGWNRHFTVYDLDPEDCAALPTLANQRPRKSYFQGDRGSEPYARVTSYVADNDGMIFLAHPESRQSHRFGTARTDDEPYPEYAAELPGLTGFAALPAGREKLTEPGGIWDRVLMEYLRGERERPIWILGDSDFHGDDQRIDATVTWIYAPELSEAAVLDAMREGRMVAMQGPGHEGVWVTEFSLSADGTPAREVMLGQTSRDAAAAEFRFALNSSVPGLKLRLIRNGEVVHVAKGERFSFDDSEFRSTRRPVYYRVEGEAPGGFVLFTNPVFHNGDRFIFSRQKINLSPKGVEGA